MGGLGEGGFSVEGRLFPEQRGDKRMTSFLRQLAERDIRGPPPAWPGSISPALPSCGGLSGPPAGLSSWSQDQKMFMNVASVCLHCRQALQDHNGNTGLFATALACVGSTVCLSVCPSARLPVCLPACSSVCLVCLSVCLSA